MARVVAVDRNPDALALATENRARLAPVDAARIELLEGSWYEPLHDRAYLPFDCIIANPPYIATGEWRDLDPIVRDFDPYEALVSGESGLEDLEVVISGAPQVLGPGGLLVCEIGASQREGVLEIAARSQFRRAEVRRDLAGRDRVLVAWY
jgi:release factor glutamine methyltransferase